MLFVAKVSCFDGKAKKGHFGPLSKTDHSRYVSSTVFFPPFGCLNVFTVHIDNFMFHYVKHETAICQEIWNLLTNVNLIYRLRCIWLLQLNRKWVILYENPIMSSYMGSTWRRINIVISIYISSPNGSNGLINVFRNEMTKWENMIHEFI